MFREVEDKQGNVMCCKLYGESVLTWREKFCKQVKLFEN